jgi:hypothetical protein
MTTSMVEAGGRSPRKPRGYGREPDSQSDKFNKDKYTIEVMLDQPCKFHSVSGKPAGHTTR